MNEFEKNIYKDIKNELVQSVIDKKVGNYFTNKNELTHYYNVGKMIVNAQGGEERAKYGDGLIRKFSERLTNELGKGYNTTTLKRMRKFFLIIEKGAPLGHQLTWSHYRELIPLKDINKINYYVSICENNLLTRDELKNRVKSNEYERLNDETKIKLATKEDITLIESKSFYPYPAGYCGGNT